MLIGHLDADCFYVSAERVRCPALIKQPVGVLGNQGACVIAKSYEMRAAGVKTGEPIWDAVKKCPKGIYVKRDFRWYEVLSRQILDAIKLVSPQVEYYSIDEMFFGADQFPLPLLDSARQLQLQILEQVGVPVSMGISLTKTLAKLLSDTTKPFGCGVLLDQEEIAGFLQRTSVGEISGIGKRSEAKLATIGVTTCWDFAQADRRLIRKLLTVTGERLWWELHGTPANPILTQRPAHKIIGRGGSMGEATADRERIAAWIVRNVERLIEELDYHQVFTQRLILLMEHKGGGGWGGKVTLLYPTASFHEIAPALKGLLDESEPALVNGMEILAEQLCPRQPIQRSFLDDPNPRAERIAEVKKLINRTTGRFSVRSGDTLPLKAIYDDETNDFDICDVRGKICF
jgi:nucleotidyltransferase/DNA polymerase involved in DNA repair